MFGLYVAVVSVQAQDVAPELAKPQAHYKAKAEKIEADKKAAVAKAAKSYLSALESEEKKALNAGKVDVVAAITKERDAALAGGYCGGDAC